MFYGSRKQSVGRAEDTITEGWRLRKRRIDFLYLSILHVVCWARRLFELSLGAVGPPEVVDITSLTDDGLVKAPEERRGESSEAWVL